MFPKLANSFTIGKMKQDVDAESLGRALFAQGDFVAAEEVFRRIASAAPENAVAHYNQGVALAKLERFEEAMGCYRAAIELNPAFADAYANFGYCLNAFDLVAQARQAFALARVLVPKDPVPILNEGIAALALGDYEAGWRDFAARWELPAYAKFKRTFAKPEWKGEPLSGKTLFLYAEQGFGDTLQTVRFVPVLIAQGAKVIIEAPSALVGLLRGLRGAPQVIEKGDIQPDFDFYSALMDVPRALCVRVDTIPGDGAYLFADTAQVELCRKLLPPTAARRIGLCWAGRESHENNHNRSLSFADFAPLCAQGNNAWVSLQRLVPEGDEAAFAASFVSDWGRHFADFSAAAAAIEALDLVITVDTAIAHLAGALGKPVWVLLPFYADWRWLRGREDSPWYPTARLFRQKKRGDWAEVIERISESLALDV